MATYASILTVDFGQEKVGTITVGTAIGAQTFSKRRLIRIYASAAASTNAPAPVVLRYTLGLSTGTTAASPTSSSPFVVTNQEIIIDLGDTYDQINLNALAADNPESTPAIIYCLQPLTKF